MDKPRFDFDVVHTPEVLLVRIYSRNKTNTLIPYAEIKLSPGADFPALYDSFRREYKWPGVPDVENELLQRYKGSSEDRTTHSELERIELASRDLAEYFKTWLVLRGRGELLSSQS